MPRLKTGSPLAMLRNPHGPFGVFVQYPVLLRLATVSVCAEIAWATLIIVLQYHFKDELLHNYAQQLIASRVATATFAFVACETILKYPMGALCDRLGPRPMILFALSIAIISPLLMSNLDFHWERYGIIPAGGFHFGLATEWWHFVPLRALDGVAAAALWPAMSSLMARSVPREAKSAAMSVFNSAYCAGLAIGPMAGLYLGHKFGNGAVFPLCAFVMIIGLVIARSVLTGDVGKRVEGEHHESISLRGKPQLFRMMALYALSQAAIGMLANVLVIYLDEQFNIHEGDMPRLMIVPAILVGALAMPIGHMGDKIGRARAVHISYVLATVGMTLVALSSLFQPAPGYFSVPIMVFGTGIMILVASYILGTPAWLGLTSLQVNEAHQGKALSLMQTSQGLGVVLGAGLVMSASALLVRSEKAYHDLDKRLPGLRLSERNDFVDLDAVPISFWLWAGALIFLVCLIGTLLWVHEPEHKHEDPISQQPAALSEV